MPVSGNKMTVEHVQLKRGNSASWTSKNPTLLRGEVGLEMDTKKFKVGDGTTAWNSLPYWCDTADSADVTIIDGGEITG